MVECLLNDVRVYVELKKLWQKSETAEFIDINVCTLHVRIADDNPYQYVPFLLSSDIDEFDLKTPTRLIRVKRIH